MKCRFSAVLVLLLLVSFFWQDQAVSRVNSTLVDEQEEFLEGSAMPPELYMDAKPREKTAPQAPAAGRGFFSDPNPATFSAGASQSSFTKGGSRSAFTKEGKQSSFAEGGTYTAGLVRPDLIPGDENPDDRGAIVPDYSGLTSTEEVPYSAVYGQSYTLPEFESGTYSQLSGMQIPKFANLKIEKGGAWSGKTIINEDAMLEWMKKNLRTSSANWCLGGVSRMIFHLTGKWLQVEDGIASAKYTRPDANGLYRPISNSSEPQNFDIMVYYEGTYGHIEMYYNGVWYSDFIQSGPAYEMWAGSYANTNYQLFRLN